jgi:ubiquinone/menaquinone biosynthesis C-methylase UbiE
MTKALENVDERTVESFAEEWSRYDQSELSKAELENMFESYFRIFPWEQLPANARGFDMGCGTGRWAAFVAERVGQLALIDVSQKTLNIARKNLDGATNVEFLKGSANDSGLRNNSQDFGYSLGVLHHIPDTAQALASCVKLIKSGAPFLVYLYYRFDNRPKWFAAIWRTSELARALISRLPNWAKHIVTDTLAAIVYWPLARLAWLGNKVGINIGNLPLYEYRNSSFYTMRTDSRDRFGTPLEQRFTREQIHTMMIDAGLTDIRFSEQPPFWCAVGAKAGTAHFPT